MKLRILLLALLTMAAAGLFQSAAAASKETFVLVHGAWMGKSAWDLVARPLERAGNEVIAVELPAHGRDHTPPEEASLDGYVNAVVTAIGDRRDVTLVGHSFGGIVISAVAERIPEKLSRLVYVAAYLPRNGDSAYSLSKRDKDSHVGQYWTQADPEKFTPVTIRKDGLVDVFCNDCDEKARQWVVEHHREEPVAPMGTPVSLTEAHFGSVPRYYLSTRKDHAVGYSLQLAMIASSPVVKVITLDSGHVPMRSMPAQVVAALQAFAVP